MKKMQMGRSIRRAAAVAMAVLTLGGGMQASVATVFATEVTSMSAQKATIKGDSVNTRSGAGTSFDKVEALTGGTEVTVTGQSTDADGKIWYQISLPSGNTAFVRNDFVELGEVIEEETTEPEVPEEPVEEEQVTETPVEEETTPIVSSQYVAVYEQDDQGTFYWYLHDNDASYRVKIDDLLEAARSVDEIDAIEKQNKTLKMALIILGIALVILVVVLIILIFRLRDYMYYEDDDEEDEPEDPRRSGGGGSFVKRRRDEDLLEDDEPPARGRGARADAGRGGRGAREAAEEQARAGRGAARGRQEDPRAAQRPAADGGRRARNVVKDDDDLEYEYLNLDDE